MKLTTISILLIPFFASASMVKYDIKQFAPTHNKTLSVDQNFSGITEEQFNDSLDKVFEVYKPILEGHDANFMIDRYWSNDTINAFAFQNGTDWHIAMYGGLARHEETTLDGFTLVACHELGHHVGGFPKIDWASNEGQSDYYGSLKCLRKVWADDDNIAIVKEMDIDPVAKELCEAEFKDPAASAMCQRSSMAGLSLGRLLADLGGDKMPKFETVDDSVVDKTNNRHPKAQCRLDTYFAGSVCMVAHDEDVDKKDPDQGVCARNKNQEIGARPKCWYARPDDEM